MYQKYQPLPAEFFVENRNKFAEQMAPNSIAIFFSNDEMPRTGDTFYPFRQNNQLYYLSGLDQEETVLVLFPNCIKEGFETVAFIRKADAHLLTWEGYRLSKEQAGQLSGIKKIFWKEDMNRILRELILLADNIYLNYNENDHFRSPVKDIHIRMAEEIRSSYPLHQFKRARPIIDAMMAIKSKEEIAVIKKAIAISGAAFKEGLSVVQPGNFEYEVEAALIGGFLKRGSAGAAFAPIVASGADSCVLHYTKNNKELKDGDLLLIDFGAEYGNYAADMTRCVPINGRFSPRQREVYESVWSLMRIAAGMLKPGVKLDEYQKEMGNYVSEALISLGLLDKEKVKRQDPESPLYRKYFMHSTSHFLGLDVHDVGGRYAALQPGMVLTVEPGIYIREENFGIRLENDFLITEDGALDLCSEVPIHPEEIEVLVGKTNTPN
jgi:Xaa-Pro aminopeptidase